MNQQPFNSSNPKTLGTAFSASASPFPSSQNKNKDKKGRNALAGEVTSATKIKRWEQLRAIGGDNA